ncbi:MAG: PKD domain-containing protein [Halobacteriaceae archaeon]
MQNDSLDDRRPGGRSVAAVAVTTLLVASVLVGALAGPALAASPPRIDDVTVQNYHDADGDGWVSGFQVTVDANTDYPEPGGIGKGDPVLNVRLNLANGDDPTVYSEPVARRDGTFVLPVKASDLWNGERAYVDPTVDSITVSLGDRDKGPGIFGVSTADMPEKILVPSNTIRMEQAADDTTREITFDSNVDGATVVVDGDTVGTTPATATFPVDYARRHGPSVVTVRSDGYRSASATTDLSSDRLSLRLQKTTKPILVTSAPDGATVSVDGREVGTTPWSGRFWVKSSHTVRVEKAGYLSQEFTDVSPEASIHADLVSLSTLQVQPPLFDIGNTTTTTTSSSTLDADVTDFGALDSQTLSTGSDSFDFATYLPSVVDALPTLDGVASANFTAAPGRPAASQSVRFDAGASYSLSGPVTSYAWDFDDGGTGSGETVAHAFDSPGTYDVALTVTARDGTQATTVRSVTVADQPPTARFSYAPGRPVAGTPFSLDAGPSVDPDGTVANARWQFDDGTTASGVVVNHTFAAPGTHDVTLSVADGAGNADTVTRTVTVLGPNEKPEPAIRLSAASVRTGSRVTFDAAGSTDPDGTVRKYGWYIGDGSIAAGQQVTHTFADPGTYEVRLTVLDDRGATETVSKEIEVTGQSVTTTAAGSSGGGSGDGAAATSRGAGGSGGGSGSGASVSQPGFTAGAALVALFVAALLVGRRD